MAAVPVVDEKMATELKDVLQAIHAGAEVLPGPGKEVPDKDEDEDMAADGLTDHFRWPDPRAIADEPTEEDIPDKELDEAEQEEEDKQRTQRKLLEELFADSLCPFGVTAPRSSQVAQVATPPRDPTSSRLPPGLQALSLGLTLRDRTITCDQPMKPDQSNKPVVLSPSVSGAAEITFRIGERWLGHNEFFCVCDQQLDAIRGGIQCCREHSAWAYISLPGAFSIGGNSWWNERPALNGSTITIRLIAAGAKGRLLQFAVDGRPVPTSSCAVALPPLYVPAEQQLRFGVLFAGDCRGDTLDVVGAQGLSQLVRTAPQPQDTSFSSREKSFAGAGAPRASLSSWVS